MTRAAAVFARSGVLTLLTIFPVATWVTPPVVAGTVHRYVEDFTTEQFKDTTATTADWDLVTGELRLFPFLPAIANGFDPPGPGFSRDLAIDGNILCMVDGSAGLRVFDVSDPENPLLRGTWISPPDGIEAFASDVVIDGDRALVADGLSGLQIVDISELSVPSRIGHFQTQTGAFARGVTVAGDFAYVAQSVLPPAVNPGLLVIDISNPTAPALAGSVTLPGLPIGVTVDGDVAYVGGGDGGLYTVAVNNPAAPAQLGNLPTPTLARNIVTDGRIVYMATAQSGLYVVDVTNPVTPVLSRVFNTPGTSFGVALAGDALYVADGVNGLLEFDITDPVNPVLAHTVDTPGTAIGVTVAGEHAYVADGSAGLEVLKVSDMVAPLPVSGTTFPMSASGVVIRGDHALVADNSFGIRSVDISDPTTPVSAGGSASVSSLSGGPAISGSYMYASTGGGQRLEVFLVSNPAAPSRLLDFDTGGEAGRMVIRGDTGYLANGQLGFTVLDLGNPPLVAVAGNTAAPKFAVAVDAAGEFAFVTVIASGLRVVDVSNPALPVTVGGHVDGVGGNDITLHGDEAYVAAGDGLRVFDISSPATPVPLSGPLGTPGVGRALSVTGDCAVMASGSNPPGGITVVDITDPALPVEVGRFATTNALDVSISGDLAYLSDWTSGLRIFQVFQRSFDLAGNTARSTNVHTANDDIIRVRLTASQNDSIAWGVTADGGVTWCDIAPGGGWIEPVQTGSDLRWRSSHVYAAAFTNPSAAGLELEWLYRFATIDSIVDVPGDTGGLVNVHFSRSGHDFADTLLITGYSVRRRVEGALPPGDWEVVGLVGAGQQDRYVAMVPTVPDTADTIFSTYSIRAHTSDSLVFWDSPPDSGFSLDNTVAVLIAHFGAAYIQNAVRLEWRIAHADLLEGFHVYRSPEREGTYRRLNTSMLPGAAENVFADMEVERGKTYWYRLGAVDRDGETLSLPVPVTVPVGGFRLFQNHPNPFNPSTTISYEVPARVAMTLQIFDVSGRLVRTLVAGVQLPGRTSVVWDGRDGRGRRVASGIYFYRLRAPGFRETRKMTLLE